MYLRNRVEIEHLPDLQISTIAALPVEELARLQGEVEDMAAHVKQYSNLLSAAYESRFAERATDLRKGEGKETGMVHLSEGEFDVECNQQKRVEWDGDKLAAILDDLNPELARFYCKSALTVPEGKFKAAPPAMQRLFSAARTVRLSTPTFKLTKKG